MRFMISALVIALLAACGQADEPEIVTPIEQPAPPPPSPAVLEPSRVEGWSIRDDDYPLLNTTAAGFAGTQHRGGRVTQEFLRGKWTIVAFWGLWSDDSLADARYIRALVSAVNQDRSLHFLSVHTTLGAGRVEDPLGGFRSLDAWFADQGGGWPTLMDNDGRIAATLRVESVPAYLLIGPDLTIEAWRGPLAETADDGIKSVIRGVAEIKRQIAAP